jgi:hypothetical protein
METYAIFANGIYWGRWTASNADAAIRNAAEDVGTDGDTTGMTAQVLKDFTLFFRSLDTGITGSVHVEASEIAEAHNAWEEEYPNTEIIGAFEGHVTPLWWEQP